MFAPMYECKNCVLIWKINVHEIIDTERDDVWQEAECAICGSSLIKDAKDEDGNPIYHAMSSEEIEDELYWNEYLNDED